MTDLVLKPCPFCGGEAMSAWDDKYIHVQPTPLPGETEYTEKIAGCRICRIRMRADKWNTRPIEDDMTEEIVGCPDICHVWRKDLK